MIKICKHCNNEFSTHTKSIKKFCSWLCYCNYKKENNLYATRTGNKQSKEEKNKRSLKMIGNKNRLGIKCTKEEIEKRRFKNTGKKRTEEQKLNLSIGMTGVKHLNAMGEKHHNWIKDRTQLSRISKQGERRTSIYFNWRKQIWLRDNFKCKIANQDCSGKIEAHHILGFKEYPELRYEINNGITLCHAHHPRKRAEEKRLSPYFQELINVKN